MVILLLIEYKFSYYFRFLHLCVCVYPFHPFFPNDPFYSNHTCVALAIHVDKTVLECTGFYLTVHQIAQQVTPASFCCPDPSDESRSCALRLRHTLLVHLQCSNCDVRPCCRVMAPKFTARKDCKYCRQICRQISLLTRLSQRL